VPYDPIVIDIYAPEGAFAEENVPALLRQVAESILKWTDTTEIPFVRRNLGTYFHLLPAAYVTAGGEPDVVVRISVTLPEVVLSTIERRRGFIQEATAIVAALSCEAHTPERTWISVVNSVDGGWGLGGQAFTNADLDEV
jgi:hypothetical protein